MSGGVDSSVAALMLIEAGYQVEGLFMKNWEEDDGTEYCTAKEDLADAQSVADQLGIHLHSANFAAEYWDGVFDHFLSEYRAGRTPNPDILCNREIKFRAFLDYATQLGADLIATGHYVQTGAAGGTTQLLKGADRDKDQSDFLHQVHQHSGSLFRSVTWTRRWSAKAASAGFVTRARRTALDLLYWRTQISRLSQAISACGPIVSVNGDELGQHEGLMYHTIGQRQGLRIGGLANRPEALHRRRQKRD